MSDGKHLTKKIKTEADYLFEKLPKKQLYPKKEREGSVKNGGPKDSSIEKS